MAGQTINVSVLADTKQFSSSMRNLSQQSGLDRLGAKFESAGRKVGTFMKTTAKGAGLAAAGIAALALKGGFERALNIEDAQAQLKALGHDTRAIDSIMQNALASVKGTAFGLGDAATLAGQAVAAGIKPGEDLERQLKLVTNTAALAKVGMGEMGSIFTKVWTRGRADSEVLNQVAERGIPIWTKLAEHYGITGAELQKMVSDGKVDAETFATVMEDTVGNAALEMGDTTRGAWANMMAALSRLGEAFLKEIFPQFKTGLTGITGLLDTLTPYAEQAGQVVARALEAIVSSVSGLAAEFKAGEGTGGRFRDVLTTIVDAARGLGDYVKTTALPAIRDLIEQTRNGDSTGELATSFQSIGGSLKDLMPAAQAFVSQLPSLADGAKVAATVLRFLADNVDKLIKAMPLIVGGFVLWKTAQLANMIAGRNSMVGMIAQIATTRALIASNRQLAASYALTTGATNVTTAATTRGRLAMMASAIAAGVKTAALKIATAAQVAFNAVLRANPIGLIITAVAALVAGLAYFFTQTETGAAIWEAAWGRIQAAGQFIVDWFVGTALPLLQVAWQGIQTAATAVADWFMAYVAPIFTAAGGLVVAVVQRLGQVWSAVWAQIQGVWAALGAPVLAAAGAAVVVLQGIWSATWANIQTIVSTAWSVISTIVQTGLQVISGVIRAVTAAIRGDWSGAWNQIKSVTTTVMNANRAIITMVLRAALSIITTTLRAIVNAWQTAWVTIRVRLTLALAQLVSTIRSKIADAARVVGTLPRLALSALGNIGSTLAGAGRQLIQGFINAIRAKFGEVKAELSRLTNLIPSWKGPASRDKTLLRGAGNLVIDGFVRGLEERYGAVRASLQGLSQDVASTPFQALDTAPTVSQAAQQQRAHEQALSADRETAVNSRLTELATALQSIPGRIEAVVEMDTRVVARGTRKGNEQLGGRTQWSQGPQLGRRAY